MLLIVSSAGRLESRYGTAGAARLRHLLYRLEDRLRAIHGEALLVLPDDPLSALGAGVNPTDVVSAAEVRSVIAALAPGRRVTSLLIVGGDDVVPFHRLPNPVRDRDTDPDSEVLTDNAYGLAPGAPASSDRLFRPELPVGRLPDFDPPNLEAFAALLEDWCEGTRGGQDGVFAVVDPAWQGEAMRVLAGFGPRLRTTPGWSARDPEWGAQRPRLLYFNLHGFNDRPEWRGFDRRTGRWVDGIRPADVTTDSAAGAAIFTENCYGAAVSGRSPRNSVALSFLAAGARAFVGATGLAFGSYSALLTPIFLDHADRLARVFVESLLDRGETFGRALVEARRQFVDAGLNTRFAQKTALQFVLYGDPAAHL